MITDDDLDAMDGWLDARAIDRVMPRELVAARELVAEVRRLRAALRDATAGDCPDCAGFGELGGDEVCPRCDGTCRA